MNYCLFITIVLLFSSCYDNLTEKDSTRIINGSDGELLDSLLTPYVEELRRLTDNEAGLAIGVTRGDDIIYARTFGYTNIEKGERVNLNSVFHIASLSKPFTAAAIAKLIQNGKLSLDDKIIDYIAEFRMKGDGNEVITVKHILTHTSGIPANISPDDWTKPSFEAKAMEENLVAIQNHSLDFEPGSKYSYSNSAFDILGIVISRVSGMTFSDYVTEQILHPAGMHSSTFHKPKDILPANYAASYSYGLETQEWTPYPYNEKLFPSSGMLTSVLDMCRWAQIHQGKGKFKEYKILEEEYFNGMVQPHFDTPWGDKIGLSWFLQSYLNRPIIMHTGQDTGFGSMIYIYPDDSTSIIVMANRDFARTGRIINAASEVLFNADLKVYTVSGKYPFAKVYREQGIGKAAALWEEMKNDTTDIYYIDDGEILTTGAILENGKRWKDAKVILEYYNTLNDRSTYSWRLLGNANLNIGDTTKAMSCYNECLRINPEYEKAQVAIDELSEE